jgi:hypothetical protein
VDDKNRRDIGSEEAQLRVLLAAMEAANQGDFSHRLPSTAPIHCWMHRWMSSSWT